MAAEPNEREPFGPEGPVPDFEEALSNLTNSELLSALDLALLELEKRLYRYAHVGPELLQMADEGLGSGGRPPPARRGTPSRASASSRRRGPEPSWGSRKTWSDAKRPPWARAPVAGRGLGAVADGA